MQKVKVKFKQWECEALPGLYMNHRLAIMLIDTKDGDLVATATVNMPDDDLDDYSIFVKDYSENEGMTQALIDAGIITNEVTGSCNSIHIVIKAYRLTPLGDELFINALDALNNGE